MNSNKKLFLSDVLNPSSERKGRPWYRCRLDRYEKRLFKIFGDVGYYKVDEILFDNMVGVVYAVDTFIERSCDVYVTQISVRRKKQS